MVAFFVTLCYTRILTKSGPQLVEILEFSREKDPFTLLVYYKEKILEITFVVGRVVYSYNSKIVGQTFFALFLKAL